MASAVAVVGSVNLDLVVGVRRLPGRGETVIGETTATGPGGKGANQAAAAVALAGDGAPVAMIGRVGDDSAGRELISDLAARGVDTRGVLVTSGVPTGHATVAVESEGGENLIVVAPGANAQLSAADVDVAPVREAQVVLLQLEVPLATVTAAVESARGVVVLNPAPSQPLPAQLLEQVAVLVPNEGELAQLAGAAGTGPYGIDDLTAMARRVSPRDVVVTLGARGALVVPGTGDPVLVPPPPINPVDTTGAGDCFCGALAVALSRDSDARELVAATRYAVAAAALSTTGVGARGQLPDDDAVRRVIRPA